MKELFIAKFPSGEVLSSEKLSGEVINNRDIVLLYPDSIGLGCGRLEKIIFQNSPRSLSVLNGRQRFFELNGPTLKRLRFKRIVEHYFLGEILWAVRLLIFSPFWVLADLVRGRR